MTFTDGGFFLLAIPATVLYFICPPKCRWVVLLIASYLFFYFNSKWLVLVLFLTTLVTWLAGLGISGVNREGKAYLADHPSLTAKEKKEHKEATKKKAKRLLVLGIVLDLSALLFLKYFNFFAGQANSLLKFAGVTIPRLNLLVPLGISFYTLQAIAYMTDIYRGKVEADRSLPKFMLFMSYFPQIVQGPIPRYNQLAHQLYEPHSFDYTRLTFGLQLFLWGAIKKMVIADRIAIPVNQIFDHFQGYTGLIVLLGAIGYGIQVYADFSGGMDMARGVSQVLGIELELNFKQPYFARSIEEFWRRWHITLGGFMRDYVFYPLSLSKTFGNLSKKSRKLLGSFIGKRLPSFLAMFIVYFLVGIWHGPSIKYIAYGVWNGVFIVAGILLTEVYAQCRSKLRIREDSHSWMLFQMLRTMLLCSVGRLFSRGGSTKTALRMMRNMMWKWYDTSFLVDGSLKELGLNTANWLLLVVFILIMLVVDMLHERDFHIRERIASHNLLFRWTIYFGAIFSLIIFGMYGPGFNSASFIYQQF